MQARVLILGASRYKFKPDGQSEEIDGCKIHYVDEQDGQEENNVGRIPQSANMDYSFYDYIQSLPLPAIFNANMTVSLRGKKPTLRIVDFEFVEGISFAQRKTAADVK